MSHEVETMAWANEVPWHGLGTKIDADRPIKEWIEAAGLDWELQKESLYLKNSETGEYERWPWRVAWRRSSDQKIIVPSAHPHWKPWQTEEMTGMMRDWAVAGGATMETLGSLRKGTVIWALAKIKGDFKVGARDGVKGYLLLTSSHMVGKANDVRLTPIRVVCANTMAMAQGHSNVVYRQDHMSAFDTTRAKDAVEAAVEELAEIGRRANLIAKLKISTQDAVEKVLLPVFASEILKDEEQLELVREDQSKLPRSILKILDAATHGVGATDPENGWGLLNGVTYWADHVQGRSPDTRMWNSWVGKVGDQKTQVEQKLFELAS
ncbi:MAG: DUF932 domain-containing protein [Euryarchaeota archaeon]|nr:DUF932 domain-containing protein [Euryarchaeota archaeon]NDB93536.1 DUF932 domain-containing protein [Euryarchaeota archaeon]